MSTPTYAVPRPPAGFMSGSGGSGGAAAGGAGDGHITVVPFAPAAVSELKLLCAVVCTSEFMAEACEALGENF